MITSLLVQRRSGGGGTLGRPRCCTQAGTGAGYGFSADPENDRIRARVAAHLAAAEDITYKPQPGRTGGSSANNSGNSSHRRGSFLKRLHASSPSASGGGSKQQQHIGARWSLLHPREARSSNSVNGNSISSGDNIRNGGSVDDGRKGGKQGRQGLARELT
ncbi:hypothetical protein PLESTF_000784800 [Pleodorina starrii]|nr:hypothetical protein PLESTM_001903500 [Pleodorina starrii]GLC69081.1 hypothetical protein PLESTF_000784800 [Pleodorina starrii]